MFKSQFGRVVLHLLTYALAAAIIAILQQLQLLDFGQYQTVAQVLLGALLDLARKYQTSL